MEEKKTEVAPYIVEMSQQVDLFTGEGEYIEYMGNQFYEVTKQTLGGDDFKIITYKPLTARDKMIGMYLYRKWNMWVKGSERKKGKTLCDFNVNDFLENDLEVEDNNYYRKLLDKSINNLRSMSIVGRTMSLVYDFNFISGVAYDSVNDKYHIEIPQMFVNLMNGRGIVSDGTVLCEGKGKVRLQPVELLKKTKNKNTQALWELIQSRGGGNGKAVLHIGKDEIIAYLGLKGTDKNNTRDINHAFKEIRALEGIEYKYSKRRRAFDNITQGVKKEKAIPKPVSLGADTYRKKVDTKREEVDTSTTDVNGLEF